MVSKKELKEIRRDANAWYWLFLAMTCIAFMFSIPMGLVYNLSLTPIVIFFGFHALYHELKFQTMKNV